jgi:hypothetical protein
MSDPPPTTLIVETTAGEEPPVDFLGPTSDIVYFISFAHTERYGAHHPLARSAAILKRKLRVNIAPLMTFADARTEDAEDEALLERIWQDAAPLAESARTVAGHRARPRADVQFPELPTARELAGIADWAAERAPGYGSLTSCGRGQPPLRILYSRAPGCTPPQPVRRYRMGGRRHRSGSPSR